MTYAAKLWGGFVDGELYMSAHDDYVQAALFTSEKEARKCFEDVRLVLVKQLPRASRPRRKKKPDDANV